MGRHDWYRSEIWDEATQTAFEARVARSRTPFSRAQYLRVQGLTLTYTNSRREVDAGRALLERVIADYPDQPSEVAGAHSALAHSYLSENCRNEAIDHLRLCLIAESGRHSWGAELDLAEALIANNPNASELDEVAALLDVSANEYSFLHNRRWRIAVSRARLHAKQGDANGAAANANQALALLADNTPKLPRHKDVGLIEADPVTVAEMRKLADLSPR